MNKYVTEFVGTFFLVLTIGLVTVQESPVAPLAIGGVLMTMVYMGGPISGAHYNPAVSIAVTLTGNLPRRQLLPYIGSQLLGALVAAIAVHLIAGSFAIIAPAPDIHLLSVLRAEVLFTAALVLVILNVAVSTRTQGNQYYGAAIGLVVMTGAFAVGGISGAVFNPAVGTGPIVAAAIAGMGSLGHLWLYWLAPVVGGLLALVVYRVQEGRWRS